MGRTGGPGVAVPTRRQAGASSVLVRDHVAYPFHAAVVRAERPGDGRSAARHAGIPRVRGPGRLGRAAARRESTILRFRHVLETHKLAAQILQTVNDLLSAKGVMLKSGTVVDATLIAAPSSTKNSSGERDPEMKQSRKGPQWYFGMKCHIGVDADSGLVHTVRGTSGAVNDVIEANSLVRASDRDVYADAGYQGAGQRPDARRDVNWHIAMRPGKRRLLDPAKPIEALTGKLERVRASIRARVEHPFRVIKRQFGHIKVRYRGLGKNTAQLHTLFALANLWMVRRKLLGASA